METVKPLCTSTVKGRSRAGPGVAQGEIEDAKSTTKSLNFSQGSTTGEDIRHIGKIEHLTEGRQLRFCDMTVRSKKAMLRRVWLPSFSGSPSPLPTL
jgi:hypothetical protein